MMTDMTTPPQVIVSIARSPAGTRPTPVPLSGLAFWEMKEEAVTLPTPAAAPPTRSSRPTARGAEECPLTPKTVLEGEPMMWEDRLHSEAEAEE